MQSDSIMRTVLVALGVCLVCSIMVASAAVSLSALQAENKKLDKLKNILQAGDLYTENMEIEKVYNEKVQAAIVDLKKGQVVEIDQLPEELQPANFDIRKVSSNPQYSTAIDPKTDPAQVKRVPQYMPIYLVKENNETQKVILPIHGKGLWSTLYGFIALERDLQTIAGLTYYEHAETPGLGGEVDNPRWKAQWKGKQAFDDSGDILITVIKGIVDKAKPSASYQIDGLAGATITTRGIDATLKFWLGERGYGPYLKKLAEEINNG